MSIWSSIGSAIGNAYNTVSNGVSSAFNYITGNSNTATASNAWMTAPSNQGPNPFNTSTGLTQQSGAPAKVPAVNYGGGAVNVSPNSNSGGLTWSQPLVQMSAGQQIQSGGSSITSSNPVYANPGVSQLSTSSPEVTMSAGGGGANLSKSLSSFNLGGATGGGTSITLPQSGSYANYGGTMNANNKALTGNGMAVDAKGNVTPVDQTKTETPQATAEKERKQSILDMIAAIPKKENILQSEEVLAQNAEVQRQRQSLNEKTALLNAVVAKQQTDIANLDRVAENNGVTKTVYGNQVNEINRQAIQKSLPIQATIAVAQGNLSLAQDYLSQLTAMKTEAVDNAYSYNMAKYNALNDYVKDENKIQLDKLKTDEERQYQQNKELVKIQSDLLASAVTNKAPQTIINAIEMATTPQQAVIAAGQYAATPDSQITQLNNGETVVVDKRTGKIISNLGGQKSVSTANIAGLTPEQANDPFIQKMVASAGGKPITDAFAQKLNKGLTVLDQIGVLQTNIKDVKTGPIVGAFKGANPWDTNAQVIKAQLNAIVPNLARGVFGEVGVLTDNDIAQYSKTLPNLKSTEDIRNAVLGITVDLIGKSIKSTLEVNAANQKDVSGFIDIYTNMQATRDSIFSQIPGYKGSGNQTSSAPVTSGATSSGVKFKVIK